MVDNLPFFSLSKIPVSFYLFSLLLLLSFFFVGIHVPAYVQRNIHGKIHNSGWYSSWKSIELCRKSAKIASENIFFVPESGEHILRLPSFLMQLNFWIKIHRCRGYTSNMTATRLSVYTEKQKMVYRQQSRTRLDVRPTAQMDNVAKSQQWRLDHNNLIFHFSPFNFHKFQTGQN